MNHFVRGFQDELVKCARSRPFANNVWEFPALALAGMIPGAAIGGVGGAGIGAAMGDEGERGESALKSGALGALIGGAISSTLLGIGTAALGNIFERYYPRFHEAFLPGATVGAVTGGGIGALEADRGERLKKGLLGAALGAGIGGATGHLGWTAMPS